MSFIIKFVKYEVAKNKGYEPLESGYLGCLFGIT